MAGTLEHRGSVRGIGRRMVGALATTAVTIIPLIAPQRSEAQTFAVLYSFKGKPSDGQYAAANLIQDAAGNLYGTTREGGRYGLPQADGEGTVFELDVAGNERVLYEFRDDNGNGYFPTSALLRDAQGDLFGTTGGTTTSSGFGGTVFKLSHTGITVLHSFAGPPLDGSDPTVGLVRDCCGNLYGVSVAGGAQNLGTVFRLDKNGNETVLRSFAHWDGAQPEGPLVSAGGGVFFGTTCGETNAPVNNGTVFKIDSTGKETVLYRFPGGAGGACPDTPLVLDAELSLYGETLNGGDLMCDSFGQGCGVVFKVDSTGHETILHTFTGGANGSYPSGGLVLDAAGNLYGVTTEGGSDIACPFGCGVVFKVDASGNETVLHTFEPVDGIDPVGGLLMDPLGNLYGTTTGGGAFGFGAIFKITP